MYTKKAKQKKNFKNENENYENNKRYIESSIV